jgi:hypothetical protein
MVGSGESSRGPGVESSGAEVDVNEDWCLGVGDGGRKSRRREGSVGQ